MALHSLQHSAANRGVLHLLKVQTPKLFVWVRQQKPLTQSTSIHSHGPKSTSIKLHLYNCLPSPPPYLCTPPTVISSAVSHLRRITSIELLGPKRKRTIETLCTVYECPASLTSPPPPVSSQQAAEDSRTTGVIVGLQSHVLAGGTPRETDRLLPQAQRRRTEQQHYRQTHNSLLRVHVCSDVTFFAPPMHA